MQVEIHQAYLEKLQARLVELRPLIQKITRREAIVQERIELEHIQLNPERLTARGPKVCAYCALYVCFVCLLCVRFRCVLLLLCILPPILSLPGLLQPSYYCYDSNLLLLLLRPSTY